MYQRQGKSAYKANLDNTWALAEITENPQNSFKSLHIAGTNGKGSTAHMLSSIFQEAGYKTGLYTSPHLLDFRERIKINGEMIPKDQVVSFYRSYHNKWTHIQPSFFEMTVLMAFDYFRKERVNIAIIETGLGGRLDSTNIITPEVSVITNIGLDHTQFLGDTIEKIAFEKAGIIKPAIPVVLGEMKPEAFSDIKEIALQRKSPFYKSSPANYTSDLKGEFQQENIDTVCKALEVIQKQGIFKIDEENIITGLKHVKQNTGLRGRFELLEDNPKIIADGAHNEAGIKLLMKEISNLDYNKLYIVWSMVSDKNADDIFKLLPKTAKYFMAESSIPRAMPIQTLTKHSQKFELDSKSFKTVKEALKAAKSQADSEDIILVTGSFFTVADALELY